VIPSSALSGSSLARYARNPQALIPSRELASGVAAHSPDKLRFPRSMLSALISCRWSAAGLLTLGAERHQSMMLPRIRKVHIARRHLISSQERHAHGDGPHRSLEQMPSLPAWSGMLLCERTLQGELRSIMPAQKLRARLLTVASANLRGHVRTCFAPKIRPRSSWAPVSRGCVAPQWRI